MKTKIINISLPERMLQDADKVAQLESRNRSELFREAMRNYLLRRELGAGFAYGERKAKELGIKPKDVNKLIADYRAGK